MDLLDDDVIDLRPRGKRTDPAAFIEQQRRRSAPLPAENQALREWDDRPAPAPPASATADLCAVCGTRQAKAACPQCGKAVCGPHTWTMLGLCHACVPR